MSTPTEIHLPDTLPFPIKILTLTAQPSAAIQDGNRLLNYSFVHVLGDGINLNASETRFGSWDATFEGGLHSWKLKVGDVITRRKAKDKPALLIVEPCKHGIQVNGLCALCGMDMENFDYTGRSESSRATIQMTHSASGPTVSLDEAQRIERETAEHLLKSRKLSLIVDLDQTIVHATVDPTVGEWIGEGEAWEDRRSRREQKKTKNGNQAESEKDSDNSGDEVDEEDEENEDGVNPNWEALKDVKKFRLAPDVFGSPRPRGLFMDKGKNKGLENEGCLYYVKPRPGWRDFLSSAAKKYEMHVYTMGTRAYAEEVCAAIDPDNRLFGGRILSRDESGSLTQKSLRRLFPCDTSMVVIIDDRADVWEWSPNLIKVIPYDFFVGIGDINSAFLPKLDPLSPASVPHRPSNPVAELINKPDGDGQLPAPLVTVSSSQSLPTSPSLLETDNNSTQDLAKKELISQNNLALEAQVEERPLAKKQEELLEGNAQAGHGKDMEITLVSGNEQNSATQSESAQFEKSRNTRKALLKNDDTELSRVGALLEEVHRCFFDAYDSRLRDNRHPQRRRESLSKRPPQLSRAYDVTTIIPRLRMNTFTGVHILFSGIIPTNPEVDHETTEIWKMARAFGATCHKDLSKQVTHVVTSKRGTHKVERAQKQGSLFIVWLSWFTDSIAQWRRQDEHLYLLDQSSGISPPLPAASSPPSDPTVISTDTDPEGTVDDETEALEQDSKDGSMGAVEMTEIGSDAFNLGDIDWQDVHDEVEAAMMESDSDDDQGNASGRTSGNISEDDGAYSGTESPRSPERKRKRLRSVTPSEVGMSLLSDGDTLKSPLSKRKKLAAERTGLSKLKEAISATDLVAAGNRDENHHTKSDSVTFQRNDDQESLMEEGDARGDQEQLDEEVSEDEDEVNDDDDDDDEDDFLARELEEEWG